MLNIVDHFRKYAKSYIINDKTIDSVLSKFKIFIETVGKSSIIHSDNGGEFNAKKFILFCEENKIKIVRETFGHPQSQGEVDKFNNIIINKLRYIK